MSSLYLSVWIVHLEADFIDELFLRLVVHKLNLNFDFRMTEFGAHVNKIWLNKVQAISTILCFEFALACTRF